jgi:type III secretory pathway component EscU
MGLSGVPAAATVAGALMMFLPHPSGAARVLQLVAFSVAHDSLPAAVALSAAAVAVVTFGIYVVFRLARSSRAGNVAAAIAFAAYALVFFGWEAGPLIG